MPLSVLYVTLQRFLQLSTYCSDRPIRRISRSSYCATSWRSCVLMLPDQHFGAPNDYSWRLPAAVCHASVGRCSS